MSLESPAPQADKGAPSTTCTKALSIAGAQKKAWQAHLLSLEVDDQVDDQVDGQVDGQVDQVNGGRDGGGCSNAGRADRPGGAL